MLNPTIEALKQENNQLKTTILEKDSLIETKDSLIETKDKLIEQLHEALKLAWAKRFGKSSEQFIDPNDPQGDLFDEAYVDSNIIDNETSDVEVKPYTRKKTRSKRQPLPDYLPREIIEYKLSEGELLLDNGLKYEIIGADKSEQLEIVPADVKVIEHIKYKYAVNGHEEYGVITATMPIQAIPKSIASSGLLAHIVQSKYCYHLPLYRQAQIWQQLDIDISRSSMSRWMMVLGEKVQPIADEIMEQIKELPYIQSDETKAIVLQEKDKLEGSHNGYMWVFNNPNGCLYEYNSSREGEYVYNKLEEYQGYIQSDAYSGYNCLFMPNSGRISVGCWAHARRKFMDVINASGKKSPKGIAHKVVKLIGKLYQIESYAIENNLSHDEIKQIRLEKSKPILNEIKIILDDVLTRTPPKGLLGKAVGYALNNWPELNQYLNEGYLPIDNNDTERKIKPFAVGRKNWLFSGNSKGAQASANLFTLIENAKLHNLKIFEYLTFVFDRIGDAKSDKDFEQLTPKYAAPYVPKLRSKNHT